MKKLMIGAVIMMCSLAASAQNDAIVEILHQISE